MKRLPFLLLVWILILPSCSKDDPEPQIEAVENIFINEIYPASGEDWIEVYNANDADKDISGYRIFDDETNKYTLPSGTVVPSKGFLVLICDDTGTGLHTNFKLSTAGETVYLENKNDEIIDKVTFLNLKDGESYGRYPDGGATLAVSGNATRGSANGDSQAAQINSVTRTVLIPQLDQEVLVKAEVISNSGIAAVKLFYRQGSSSFQNVGMSKNGNFYEGIIPAFSSVGRVEYYVSAETTGGKTTVSPFDAPDDAYHYLLNTDALPTLFVNEFMAVNTACCPDTDGDEQEFDDWVEIYNAGSVAVDIGGMYLSDDPANPFQNRVSDDEPSLTTIPPGGFIVLWADEQGSQGILHMNFRLTAEGESIGIFYKDGRTIDVYNFAAQQENVSRGRMEDGASTWTNFSSPTPGATNE